MNAISNLLIKLLRDLADRLDAGNCEMSDEEMLQALSALEQYDTTTRMSKDQACSMLDVSRSTFDSLVRSGEIPKGQKVRGFKELFWTKSDLMKYDKKKMEKTSNTWL